MPLSPAGERPPTARPVTLALVPGATAQVPALRNGNMSEGAATPAGWNAPWNGEGKVSAVRDTQEFKSGPASLRLQSEGGTAYGSINQSVPLATAPFRLTGWAKTRGQVQEALIALRTFDKAGKQQSWETLLDAREARDWTTFGRDISMPETAARAEIVITFRGNGAVWLDDLEAHPAPAIFPQR
jgi:hypothetical protein